MTRIKSTLKNNILSLLLTSLIMSAILVFVYFHTKAHIENSLRRSDMEKIQSVLPAFDNDPIDSAKIIEGLVFYTAKKGDSIVGYACKTYTEKGFNGNFSLMIGFLPDGKIYKTAVLEQHETPGFGTRMNTGWKNQFNGKDLTTFNLRVKKDSGDVDAISSATISSRAYCDAIEKAYISLMKNILKKKDTKLASDKNDNYILNDGHIVLEVMPEFNKNPLVIESIEGLDVYLATKNNKPIGYAIKSSAKGYGGTLWILTGIYPDGKINKIIILQSKETVGYGSRLNTEPQFLSQFKGKTAGKFISEVKKDGGDVDAVSGATISSRAFCEALDKACSVFVQHLSTTKEEVKKDTVALPSKPAIYQFTDKSIFSGVLPPFDNDPLKDFKSVNGLDLYFGKQNGTITGVAVTTFSNKGYNGKIILLIGFTPAGIISNTLTLSQNETQGMGSQMTEDYFKDQFNGMNPATAKLSVKDDGGDVDAISGATISSRAYCDALQKAFNAFKTGMK